MKQTISGAPRSGWQKTVHAGRIIASSALLGTVIAGTFFGWLPALGMFSIHEVGALIGAGFGLLANAKNVA